MRVTISPNQFERPRFGPGISEKQVGAAILQVASLVPYTELNTDQRHLLGPDGVNLFGQLSPEQKAVFLLLTARLKARQVDFSQLVLENPLKTITPTHLFFKPDPAAMDAYRKSLDAGVAAGRFNRDWAFPPLHPGMHDHAYRENQADDSMHLGMGPKGAFVHIDQYDPWKGWKPFFGHCEELIEDALAERPSPYELAKILGVDLDQPLPEVLKNWLATQSMAKSVGWSATESR